MTETRTLLVIDAAGRFKIEIPADYKVTFGRQQGSGKSYIEGPDRELRIYESDTKQRACFTNVESFRDLSLPMEREVITEEGSITWSHDDEGSTQTKSLKRQRKVVKENFED